MIVFIPEADSKLKLNKDWTFDLYLTYDNKDIYLADGHEDPKYSRRPKAYKRTLPAGSEFLIKKIEVTQSSSKFSTVVLCVTETTDNALTNDGLKTQPFVKNGVKHYGKFWVKLSDYNNAEFDLIASTCKVKKEFGAVGDPITLETLRRRSSFYYWVKFEHKDPKLSFFHKVHRQFIDYERLSFRSVEMLSEGWKEEVNSYVNHKNELQTDYIYTPPYFCDNIVNTVGDWDTDHPLKDQIHIPTDRKLRIEMGIKTNKTPIENIEIAGGKLSIYDIVQ